ncbi:hypothetical protein PCH_Pc12g01180 [Penicillium rubens Wisconsin 54-1255]|uniref:Uncharacterized protein n=1 Tax=Penicillium rubens (strain ATCC 28089 / DSM 1075 / NRRL 1951 / Wisconsin 54-1255) TaxID=500485 RepID=B6GYI0_PENRW|nr:hypothetical protein PCH_Pc12g01180 [Penicillium rubens Wisconsin 54-1255]
MATCFGVGDKQRSKLFIHSSNQTWTDGSEAPRAVRPMGHSAPNGLRNPIAITNLCSPPFVSLILFLLGNKYWHSAKATQARSNQASNCRDVKGNTVTLLDSYSKVPPSSPLFEHVLDTVASVASLQTFAL